MAHPDHDPDVGDVIVVPWTAELAMRVVGMPWTPDTRMTDAGRALRVQAIRDSVDDDRLPAEAVDVLIAAGWTELDD